MFESLLCTRKDAPPSSERYSAYVSDSTKAYTTSGLAGLTASPILPRLPSGRPSSSVRSTHVLPPSWVTYKPLPSPPLSKNQGSRRKDHIAANNLSGLDGSMTSSAHPVRSSTFNTCDHVWPPSVVLYTPRSGLSPHAEPVAATNTVLGSRG